MARVGANGSYPTETLGALASVLSIWVVTAALVYLAAARIISNDYEIEARAMLATSACAVGVNLVYVPRGAAPLWSLCTISLSPAPPMPLEPQEPQLCPQVTLCLWASALCPQALSPPLPCPAYAQGFQSVCLHPHAPQSLAPQAAPPKPYHEPHNQTPALFLHTFQPCCASSPTPLYRPKTQV